MDDGWADVVVLAEVEAPQRFLARARGCLMRRSERQLPGRRQAPTSPAVVEDGVVRLPFSAGNVSSCR
ncbi:hypothetical protein ACFPN7_26360 [Amycolatopsis halotolerans]|uniref:hypothetical protein n=1 Tax=Amycolatopsis halotolerans TaxID=330083 RepID=UPI00361ADE5F